MKTTHLTLDLQAYVDGELEPKQKAAIERVLQTDAEARSLVEGLQALSRLVRDNEPARAVPASRDFYWSQIQQRIDAADRVHRPSARPAQSALHWLRWLVPALGVAAVAVVISSQNPSNQSSTQLTDSQTLTFHSDADGVTIAWIN